MITTTKLVKCPECGEDAITVRGSEDFEKVTGWRNHPRTASDTVDILCVRDKLIFDWKPPRWKMVLLGPYAYPKELR